MEKTIGAQVAATRRYYGLVDSSDLDAVVMCFSPNAVYNRPGYPEFRGRASIREFYKRERMILSGQHLIEGVVGQFDHVAVRGTFQGTVRGGLHVEIGFADFFVFDESGRFSRRDTYFSSPAV